MCSRHADKPALAVWALLAEQRLAQRSQHFGNVLLASVGARIRERRWVTLDRMATRTVIRSDLLLQRCGPAVAGAACVDVM
jgi:hypothetical protein